MTRLLVNIDVGDLDRAIAFYCSALELRLGRRLGPGIVELRGTEAPIYLLEKPGASAPFTGSSAGRTYARHWTPIHLDFAVDDLDRALTRALAAGATLEGAVTNHAWGRLALCADPFGHGFCLLQFSTAGYDAIAT